MDDAAPVDLPARDAGTLTDLGDSADLRAPADLRPNADFGTLDFLQEMSGVTTNLLDVYGTSAVDVWAVGEKGTILHRDGMGWRSVVSPTGNQLQGVWASGPTDAWAVGAGGSLLHYDGTAWASVPSGTTKGLSTIHGFAADRVYAGGADGLLLAYNGVTWTAVSSSLTTTISAVWAAGPRQVYLTTRASTFTPTVNQGSAIRLLDLDTGSVDVLGYVGQTSTDVFLWGIHGRGGTIWAVGNMRSTLGCGDRGLVFRTTGGPLQRECTNINTLRDVSVSGADEAWVTASAPYVMHWRAGKWEGRPPAYGIPTGSPSNLYAVWSSGPSPAPTWFVGAAGTIMRR